MKVLNIVWLFCLLGCGVKEVYPTENISLPVISGYISPSDSISQISVQYTHKMNEPINVFAKGLTDAEVSIEKNQVKYRLTYNPETDYYEAPIKYNPSDTINLKVILKSGIIATAQTIIPSEYPDYDYHYLGDTNFEICLKNNEKSFIYYRLLGEGSNGSDEIFYFKNLLPKSQTLTIGKNIQLLKISGSWNNNVAFERGTYKNKIFKMVFSRVDQNVYNFDKTNIDFLRTSPLLDKTPRYNNIQGGLGIFGSYLNTYKTFNLDKP